MDIKQLLSAIKGLGFLIYSAFYIGISSSHASEGMVINPEVINFQKITLNSYSFNAKKRSSFTIDGQTEVIERGLTIVHFNSSTLFEYKNFDTYGSTEACKKVVEIISDMLRNKSVFAILAHDSATNTALKESKVLTKLGFFQLVGLKSRQAYIMHNFSGKITEMVDNSSIEISIDLPNTISDKQIYFPKIRYAFKPSNDRYIAHAGGEINGVKSTNSKEALDANYKKGFRLFELDIIKTSDEKLVAAHDWGMWSRFTDFQGNLPPTHEEFMKHKIYGDYSTLDMKGINEWFAAHPDAILVTDKLNDPVAFANEFIDRNRLIMELFSPMAVEIASKNGIQAMISQEPLFQLVNDKLNFLVINNVKYAAVSRRVIEKTTKLMLQLKEAGIKVYVYNVNFDPGKDERYVQENEIGLVYGMYADKWVFDKPLNKTSK